MKFVMHARHGDWHIQHPRSRVWACAKTIGETLRYMQRQIRSHDYVCRTMEVTILQDTWTRRCLREPRLISHTSWIHERVAEPDEVALYFIRHVWTEELHYLAKLPAGRYPAPPSNMVPVAADPDMFAEMEAFGVPHLKTSLPNKWIGVKPDLLPCLHSSHQFV